MTKHILLIIIQLLLFLNIDAQPNVDWSPELSSTLGNGSFNKMIGIINQNYYVVNRRNRKSVIQKFSMDDRLVKVDEFDFFGNNGRYVVEDIVKTSKDTFFYIHEYYEKEREWILYACDFKDGKFQKPKEIFFESYRDIARGRIDNAFAGFENYSNRDGGLVFSPDSTKLGFVNIIPRSDHKQSEVVSCVVYDSALNQIWKASFDYKFSDTPFQFGEYQLANNGIFYFTGSYRVKRSKKGRVKTIREQKLPQHRQYLYSVDKNGIRENEIDLGAESAAVNACIILSVEDPDLMFLAGHYSNGEKANRYNGLYTVKANSNLEFTNPSFFELSEDIKNASSFDFQIYDVLRFENGSFGFVAEEEILFFRNNFNNNNYYDWRYNNFNQVGLQTLNYSWNDLVIPVFDVQGQLQKLNFVLRRYDSLIPRDGSYQLARAEGKTFIIYNDIKPRKVAKDLGLKGRNFTDIIELDSNGDIIAQETIISKHNNRYEYTPQLSTHDDNVLIFGNYNNHRLQFAKIYLK